MILRRLLLISICIIMTKNYAQENEVVLSPEYRSVKDTIVFNAKLKDLTNLYLKDKNTVPLEELDMLIKVGNDLNHANGLGRVYDLKAKLHRENSEYSKSVTFFKKAIVYFKETNNEKEIAGVHNELHITEKKLGNLEKSAYYLLEAKKYFEKTKDSSSLTKLFINLGTVNLGLKDYENSESAFLSAIAIKENTDNVSGIDSLKNSLALVYVKDKKYDQATELASASLQRYKQDSLSQSAAFSYSILGEIKEQQKEYTKAKRYYDSAYTIYQRLNATQKMVETEQSLGFVEFQLGNYTNAEKLFVSARKGFNASNSKENLLNNYEWSSKLDSARGNLSGALAWQRKYQNLSDQIASELSTKQIENREEFYKSELEQIRTIDEQESRAQRNKEELFRYRVFALIILGVLAISLLYASWIIRTRKERKQLIAKLNESNQVKHKLFSIISHDLKNEVHGLEASLNLMNDNHISPDEFGEVVPLLADKTNQTSILLNNLLNWSKSQMKELKAKPVNFDVQEVIANKFIFFKSKAQLKSIELVNELKTTEVFADKDMVSIVAQNLIANAIKFCNSGDAISLLSEDKGDSYEIHFKDTGVGIKPEYLSKLFAEETFTTRGTKNEAGTGLGLRICKELVELNNGTIRVASTLGEGSTFSIVLPKAS